MTKQKERFSSVWDALEESPAEAQNMKLRSTLMMEIKSHIEDSKLTQVQAAKLLGITQPRVSDLMRGKIDLFGIDMLVNLATAAGMRVELHLARAA